MLTGIANGDFAIADVGNPNFGWDVRGDTEIVDGTGVLNEDNRLISEFAQTFNIPAEADQLRFTIHGAQLVHDSMRPPDAFEVALLADTTGQSLVATSAGLQNTDAFLNLQSTGEFYFGADVSQSLVATSGDVATLDEPTVVLVDLTGVTPGTTATLYFDLLGFGSTESQVVIDNVALVGVGPPLVDLRLEGVTDSGVKGDGITNVAAVNLVGITDPNVEVALDVDGDGFDDGTTTADQFGRYRFENVSLTEGANQFGAQASNAQGTTDASIALTLETQPPTGVLVEPQPDATVDVDLGYVDVQWTDAGTAGLDVTTFDADDVTVTGVSVDRAEDLSGGLVRYHYADDGNELNSGIVEVTLVAGQVADVAANAAAQQSFSFTLTLQGLDQPPEVDLNGPAAGIDFTTTFTEDSGTTTIVAPDMTVTDPESVQLVSATVTLTNPLDGTDEVLTVDTSGSLITADYTPATGMLELTGADSVANFQTVLRSLTYNNLSQNPDPTSRVITVVVKDGLFDSQLATINLDVTPVDDPPDARDDDKTLDEDSAVGIDVVDNDSDVEGNLDPTTVTVTTPAGHGQTTVNATTGEVTYSPEPDFNGADNFVYEICDTTGLCDSATVNLTIDPINDPPAAVDDTYDVDQNQTLMVDAADGVLINDMDIDSVSLSALAFSGPTTNGTLTLSADGSFTYTPNADFSGTDSFEYTVSDGNGGSDGAVVTITVNKPLDSDPPVGTLVSPAIGSTIHADLGYVDVQWTDVGSAGLDTSTFGVSDVTVTGVTIDVIQDLGGGLVRYNYGQNDTLPSGLIEVTQIAGDVADLAGNTNLELTQSFTFAPSGPQDVSNLVQVQYFGTQVNTRTRVITFQGLATNTSTQPLFEPITLYWANLQPDNLVPLLVDVDGADVGLPAGTPGFELTTDDGILEPGESTLPRSFALRNPNLLPYSFENIVWALVGAPLPAPAAFAIDAVGGNPTWDDFESLRANFGRTSASHDQGDYDGDGDVDFADFLILARKFAGPTTQNRSVFTQNTVVDDLGQGLLDDELVQASIPSPLDDWTQKSRIDDLEDELLETLARDVLAPRQR